MSPWEPAIWTPAALARTKRERWSGGYWTFVPFSLARPAWTIEPQTAARAAQVERRMLSLRDSNGAAAFEGVARFLLRSEAIASSRIEGVAPSVKKVVMAELTARRGNTNFGDQAAEVAGNIRAIDSAVVRLADSDAITWHEIERLQADLLPGYGALGTRTTQNWLGGSYLHPGQAEFVPPTPERLGSAISDLLQFLNGSAVGGLIQAALVHAQFESLHPFGDGNGRIGRALIHTVLVRRGLTHGAVLPVSQVLMTLQEAYVDGLTSYRGPAANAEGSSDSYLPDTFAQPDQSGINAWLEFFIEAADRSVDVAHDLLREVVSFKHDAEEQVRALSAATSRRVPRSDAAVWALIRVLPRSPILTDALGAELTGRSRPAIHDGLALLEEAGVVRHASIGKWTRGYTCPDLLEIITLSERRLASTALDTRASPPTRPAPHLPSN